MRVITYITFATDETRVDDRKANYRIEFPHDAEMHGAPV